MTEALPLAPLVEEQRREALRLAGWVAIIFNPVYLAWSGFDWVLERQSWLPLLAIRLTVVTVNSAVTWWAWRGRRFRWAFPVCLTTYYVYAGGVAAMFPLVEHNPDSYVMGLSLATLGSSLLPTWPRRWGVANALGILMLALPVLMMSGDLWAPTDRVASTFLLITSATIGVVGAVTKARAAALTYELRVRERALSEELRQARDQAVDAARVKGAFVANMSHEIRTPLNAVIGYASLLDRAKLGPDEADMVAGIENAGQILLGLVNDVLDYSKLEAGRVELEHAPLDLGELSRSALAVTASRAQEKGLALRLELPDALRGQYLGDRGRLLQILLNLLGNAVKFTSSGSVALEWSSTDEGWLRAIVRDTGIGMSPAARARLFTPFTQADATITRRFGGTGLGLSITRLLVEAMGGRIGVDSEPDQGSTFWFEVPLERCAAPAPTPAPRPVPAAPADGAPLEVLVAEDNLVNQAIVRRMLDRLGCRVDVAVNGVEAVSLSTTHRYDLILMDAQMPEMDGLEATRRIRTSPAHARTRVVALTANVTREYREACAEVGMDEFLAKPVTLEQLSKTVSRAREARGAT